MQKTYSVNKDLSVKTLRGEVLSGQPVTEADFSRGKTAIKELVDAEILLEHSPVQKPKAAKGE